jgi:biotin carboxyl carrier protein
MPTSATAIALQVAAKQSAYLSFEVAGVLEAVTVDLGAKVQLFDFPTFYTTLRALPTVPGAPMSLQYDVDAITAYAQPALLASLRNEPAKIALAKSLASRQNAYFRRYTDTASVAKLMTEFYGKGSPESKLTYLDDLSGWSQAQANALAAAYKATGRDGVVFRTSSELTSSTKSTGSQNSDSIGETESGVEETLVMPALQPAGGSETGNAYVYGPETTASYAQGTSSGTATESQKIVNTDYGYRMPKIESDAANARAQARLYDERIAAFVQQQSIPYVEQMLANERFVMDNDVYRTQLGFLSTLLMSPVGGMVTGLFKHVGEVVRAGEPVLRVEDPSTIYVAGTIKCRARVTIGGSVSISTALFDAAGPATTLTGTIVAARGHGQDDLWEIVVEYDNLDASGQPIFPLGYRFDFASTTVTVN